jgi:hypothetical protein
MPARHSFRLPVITGRLGHGFKDLTGQRFNRLTVLERADVHNGAVRWVCLCDCGSRTRVRSRDLRSGSTRSCGCLRREQMKALRAEQLRGAA